MGLCEDKIRDRYDIELREGICLFIKNNKNINSIIFYYFHMDRKLVPFLIISKDNIKEDNDKILLYDTNYMISLHKLREKIEYEKYGYVFFDLKEKLIPIIPNIFHINKKILIDKEDEVSIGNQVKLLYNLNNLKNNIKFVLKIDEKDDKIFVYKSADNRELDSFCNLIEDNKHNIIGIKLENNYGILIKPLFKEFFKLREKIHCDNNNLNQNSNLPVNYKNIIQKYIVALFLALAKIEKLKVINDNSFKIEENEVINSIVKFIKYYNKNEISKAKEIIKEFEFIYHEKDIQFKQLFDFISKKSYLQFQIDKILEDSFIQNQNIIQKKLFVINKSKEKCNDIIKQYICNSMYLYSKNKNCKNLESLIYEWENEEKEKCSKCTKHSIKKKIIYWPEILTFIWNDNNNIKIIDKLKIEKYQKEYKLVCYIGYSENNNFNIVYKRQNKWYMIKTDEKFTSIEITNNRNFSINYPWVLFYEKIKKNRHNTTDFGFGDNQNNEGTNNIFIDNNSKGQNMNLNIENENKNKIKKTHTFILNNKDNNYKSLNSINSDNLNNPTSNALLNKNKYTETINSGTLNNHTSNINISNNLDSINHNNLNSINSQNHRSYTPIPIYKASKKNKNLNNNKIHTINNNNVKISHIYNHKKSFDEVNYNPKIILLNKNNKLLLNENTNKYDTKSFDSNTKTEDTKINKNNIINNEDEKEITLYFIFQNGKELYLDVKNSMTFSEVIDKLKEKYLWLEDNIKIKEYKFKGKIIYENKKVKTKNVKNIGLKDESHIYIIESN